MPQATAPVDQEIVRSCIQYRLEQLTYANGSFFNGIVVDVAKNPLTVAAVRAADFDAKNVLVTLNIRDFAREPNKSLGGVKRKRQIFNLNCLMRLTNAWQDAGWDVDSMRFRLAHDVEWLAFDADQKLHGAADALGLDHPSCINLQVDKAVLGESFTFPDARMVLVCSYEFDERRPG